MRDDDRESAVAFFFQEGCACTKAWQVDTVNKIFDENQLADVLLELFLRLFRDLAHESCIKGAKHVRGGVLKSRLVADNERECTMFIRTQSLSVPQS